MPEPICGFSLLAKAGAGEHALAWKLSQSPMVEHIFCCAWKRRNIVWPGQSLQSYRNSCKRLPKARLACEEIANRTCCCRPGRCSRRWNRGVFQRKSGLSFHSFNAPANKSMKVESLALLQLKRPQSSKAQRRSLKTSCGNMEFQPLTTKISASTSLRRLTLLLCPLDSSLKYPD